MRSVPEAMVEAHRESALSQCVRRHVGAVLVDCFGIERGRGHNTESDGRTCMSDCPRAFISYEDLPGGSPYGKGEVGECISQHAEIMALWQACINFELTEMQAWTMVVTCEPCDDCRLTLEANGILTVFDQPLQTKGIQR